MKAADVHAAASHGLCIYAFPQYCACGLCTGEVLWPDHVASPSPTSNVAFSQATPASSSAFAQGRVLSVPRPAAARCQAQRLVTFAEAPQAERLRLSNLSPQDGSRRKEKRKGRGYGAGQVRRAVGPCMLLPCASNMLHLSKVAGLLCFFLWTAGRQLRLRHARSEGAIRQRDTPRL